jgi:hypothetical protein
MVFVTVNCEQLIKSFYFACVLYGVEVLQNWVYLFLP